VPCEYDDMLSEHTRVSASEVITAFAGNDAIRCRLVNVGLGGLCLISPFARESGGFVRIQTQLAEGVWLDTDGILTDCVRSAAEWRWEIHFTRLEESQRAALEGFIRSRPAPAKRAPRQR